MATPARPFSPDLLTQPAAARLAAFADKVVAHPRLKDAHQALLEAIRQPAGASLIFVVGPTGVGKTTLRLRVEQELAAVALPELVADPSRIPVVGVEAVAPESGSFNWKDYYTRVLLALHEPLIAEKYTYGVRGLRWTGPGRLVVGPGIVVADLRRALEECLRQRRPTAVLVDEAQHFKKVVSGRRLLDQMDTLKSLASLTSTVHVLIGTYELLALTGLSAQLSRRSRDIHFGRYRYDDAADRQAFQSVVLTFQRHLPLAAEPDLVGATEYLYERSVGCVGVLKTWLTQALALALADEQPTLTRAHLDRTGEPAWKVLRLARELAEGETALHAPPAQRQEVRALLGLPAEATADAARPDAMGPASRRSGRVGQRAPQRDPVERAAHGA
jgi:hypothetical protein